MGYYKDIYERQEDVESNICKSGMYLEKYNIAVNGVIDNKTVDVEDIILANHYNSAKIDELIEDLNRYKKELAAKESQRDRKYRDLLERVKGDVQAIIDAGFGEYNGITVWNEEKYLILNWESLYDRLNKTHGGV